MRTLARTACALGLLLSGCISSTVEIGGVQVPRQNLTFTGQPYHVRHDKVHPGHGGAAGGLSGAGGAIAGQVCGVDVVYDVTHSPDHTQLVGTLDNEFTSQIRVQDVRGMRIITGSLASMAVDLRLTPSDIVGYVGRRGFGLHWDGDSFSDQIRITNFNDVTLTRSIGGKEALWQMPAADQAAIVPLMLTCLMSYFEHEQHYTVNFPPLRFGGQTGALPRKMIVLR